MKLNLHDPKTRKRVLIGSAGLAAVVAYIFVRHGSSTATDTSGTTTSAVSPLYDPTSGIDPSTGLPVGTYDPSGQIDPYTGFPVGVDPTTGLPFGTVPASTGTGGTGEDATPNGLVTTAVDGGTVAALLAGLGANAAPPATKPPAKKPKPKHAPRRHPTAQKTRPPAGHHVDSPHAQHKATPARATVKPKTQPKPPPPPPPPPKPKPKPLPKVGAGAGRRLVAE